MYLVLWAREKHQCFSGGGGPQALGIEEASSGGTLEEGGNIQIMQAADAMF